MMGSTSDGLCPVAYLSPFVWDAMRLYKDQAKAMHLAAEPLGTLRSSVAVAPAALVDANEVSRRMAAQSVSAFAALPPQK